MALPEHFLEELRARTPLPSLIGRRTKLTRAGRQWKGCCPFHNEKSPSFYVYDDHFHCFGCGAHGDAFAFVMRSEGGGFMDAVERLAAEAGLEVPKPTPQAREREQRAKGIGGVLAAAAEAYRKRLFRPEGAEALAYLRRRGLTDETIARFGLGWSGAGRGALAAELKADGVEVRQLLEAGLMQERDHGPVDLFFNRVMFPIRDRKGRVISFGGRILGDGQPKYVNGPETAVFSKRRNLYNLDLAREAVFRGQARLLVVEGYMDVIALDQAGFGGAVAPLGTALTAEQLQALWQVSPEPVLCFDGDAAGARAAARAAEVALPLLAPERSLRFATLTGGEDPDTLIRKGGPAAFEAVLAAAQPLHEALFGILVGGTIPAAPEARAALRNRLAAAAQTIPDKALAAEYRSALFERFFAAARGPRRIVPPKPVRPRPDPEAVRAERARMLLAILLRHPALLRDVEEPLMLLDLPVGAAERLRSALLAWLAAAERLDSGELIAHLAGTDPEATSWALKPGALPAEAMDGAQPAEALDAFWQIFGLLHGADGLEQDRQRAVEELTRTNDLAVQLRVIRLTEALAALRRGEPGASE
ncbi:MAG: DNA primase [Acetobacteraceae bacterium]|nr:DNA primase [Acetobacteraceae bacterium]